MLEGHVKDPFGRVTEELEVSTLQMNLQHRSATFAIPGSVTSRINGSYHLRI